MSSDKTREEGSTGPVNCEEEVCAQLNVNFSCSLQSSVGLLQVNKWTGCACPLREHGNTLVERLTLWDVLKPIHTRCMSQIDLYKTSLQPIACPPLVNAIASAALILRPLAHYLSLGSHLYTIAANTAQVSIKT